MKQFLTAIITIGVLVHVVLAGPMWTKRSILDFSEPSTNGSLNFANNTSNGSEINCKPLNDSQAQEKIISLGVLENHDVSLLNVSGSLLRDLQANGTVTIVLAKRKKRDVANELCPEEAFLLYTRANEGGVLAYRIAGSRCQLEIASLLPQCSIQIGDSSLEIGGCVKAVATIVLQVMSKCGDQYYKTVEVNCSCKCNKYSNF